MLALGLIGTALLLHSVYSSWELSELAKIAGVQHVLPKDVAIEAISGLVILILSAVWTASRSLKPTSLAEEYSLLNSQGENPYGQLETRPMFQDILARREVYHEWKAKSDPRVDPERDPALEEYKAKKGNEPPAAIKRRNKNKK